MNGKIKLSALMLYDKSILCLFRKSKEQETQLITNKLIINISVQNLFIRRQAFNLSFVKMNFSIDFAC